MYYISQGLHTRDSSTPQLDTLVPGFPQGSSVSVDQGSRHSRMTGTGAAANSTHITVGGIHSPAGWWTGDLGSWWILAKRLPQCTAM